MKYVLIEPVQLRSLELTQNTAERALLRGRIFTNARQEALPAG